MNTHRDNLNDLIVEYLASITDTDNANVIARELLDADISILDEKTQIHNVLPTMLGRRSARKREGITNYSELAKKRWAKK